jgi:hypothetical protein
MRIISSGCASGGAAMPDQDFLVCARNRRLADFGSFYCLFDQGSKMSAAQKAVEYLWKAEIAPEGERDSPLLDRHRIIQRCAAGLVVFAAADPKRKSVLALVARRRGVDVVAAFSQIDPAARRRRDQQQPLEG